MANPLWRITNTNKCLSFFFFFCLAEYHHFESFASLSFPTYILEIRKTFLINCFKPALHGVFCVPAKGSRVLGGAFAR
jgi:hypothetical protein